MLIFGIVANAAAAAAAASVAVLRRSLCVFCYYKTQPANFIINSHTHTHKHAESTMRREKAASEKASER